MTADLHHLVTAYALDALDDDERTVFEGHLAGCDVCRSELDELSAVATQLAGAAATAPPPHLKAAVMGEIARTEQIAPEPATAGAGAVVSIGTARRRRKVPMAWLASAAAIALLVIGAVVVVGLRSGGDSIDDVRAAADAVVVPLALTPEGDAGSIEIVWSDDRDQVALIADGLADPGPGLVYELWAIVDGVPVPSGLFDTDDGSIRRVAEIANVDPEAFGVTIEPDTGSEAPTGDILFFGEV